MWAISVSSDGGQIATEILSRILTCFLDQSATNAFSPCQFFFSSKSNCYSVFAESQMHSTKMRDCDDHDRQVHCVVPNVVPACVHMMHHNARESCRSSSKRWSELHEHANMPAQDTSMQTHKQCPMCCMFQSSILWITISHVVYSLIYRRCRSKCCLFSQLN